MATKEFTFRGHPFKVACDPIWYPPHPTWFTFVDEAHVRTDKWLIEPGDCVLDVGAAYGSYALTALAAGAALAFVWSPQGPPGGRLEHEYLSDSLALNGWGDRCVIYASGVYDRTGWLNAETQEFYETQPAPDPQIISVRPLDAWYAGSFLKRCSPGQFPRYWMKLDVEGAEVEVLKSAERLIRELRPSILVENHAFKRPTIEQEVRELLTAGGAYREIGTAPHHAVTHSLYQPAT